MVEEATVSCGSKVECMNGAIGAASPELDAFCVMKEMKQSLNVSCSLCSIVTPRVLLVILHRAGNVLRSLCGNKSDFA